jgi:prepilin-type N-terminal cleavage/methylation domain-containing protein
MRPRLQQTGFSLIELMISMVLGLVIVLGTGSFYSTLRGTILESNRLERAQENLRTVAQIMGRSLHQGETVTVAAQSLTVTYGSIQAGDVVLGCLGRSRANGDTDTFTFQNNNVLCSDGVGAAQIIATNIASIAMSANGNYGVNITLTPMDMPTALSGGVTMRFALRQKYIKDHI